MPRNAYVFVALALMGAMLGGCVQHIRPYEQKRRTYSLPVSSEATPPSQRTGSLWNDGGQAAFLMSDLRAARPNDVLTIAIDEYSSASEDASTKLSRSTEVSANIEALAGLLDKLSSTDGDLIKAATKNGFDGKGRTTRTGRVLATVPAMVRQVLDNGQLFVEGHRVVLVNSEEQHFYISGVVRPQDIEPDNSVMSSRLADAQIEITGRGVVSDRNTPGWFTRALDWVWPF